MKTYKIRATANKIENADTLCTEWKKDFTAEELTKWMEDRAKLMSDVYCYNDIKTYKYEDGSFLMVCFRHARMTNRGLTEAVITRFHIIPLA